MKRVRFLDHLRPRRAVLPTLLLCGSIAGCGPGKAEVTGVVRYDGKPLTHGTILFLGSDGVPCSGNIGPDGTYSVQVPIGEAQVIVNCVDEERLNRTISQAVGNRGRAAPPTPSNEKFSLIPQRYSDWNASGLTVRVERSKTVKDFELTSH
jgi:hypothetical protein